MRAVAVLIKKEKDRLVKRKVRIFNKQKGLCHWCNKPMLLLFGEEANQCQSPRRFTADHIYPRGDSRRQTIGGRVGACYECNHNRGSMNYHEFSKLVGYK